MIFLTCDLSKVFQVDSLAMVLASDYIWTDNIIYNLLILEKLHLWCVECIDLIHVTM